MAEESVKVAVRLRPFNQRETDRNAKLTIEMQDATTVINNPDDPKDKKSFAFDYSYWSHDGFKENSDGLLVPVDSRSRYISQQKVFDDLGRSVLQNAFEGYNCSLFAYGQTGSGKSYSVVGYGNNRGIVPLTCEELFRTVATNKSNNNMRYEVTFSMLEIYNEQVRDLLSKDSPKGGLQVRQSAVLGGFFVEGLKHVPVGSYDEIQQRMDQGTSNRTVAATNMNATSSRAHTVVTVTFNQIYKTNDGDTKKSSVINLVDLAGSERADSTGATGDRLREGANINKSLSALGNVIAALADLSANPKKKIVVPYRDSVLTKLLMTALGGNSKTIMIAALSPADINYDETVSTLRYADRAKRIKTKAFVNENPVEKMIRELKEENERLKRMMEDALRNNNVVAMQQLSAGLIVEPEAVRTPPVDTAAPANETVEEAPAKKRAGSGSKSRRKQRTPEDSDEDEGQEHSADARTRTRPESAMPQVDIEELRKRIEDEIRAQLLANQTMIAEAEGDNNSNWQTKLQQARTEQLEETEQLMEQQSKRQTTPYLSNLNEDPQLSDVIAHFIEKDATSLGRSPQADICLRGLNIGDYHAKLIRKKGKVVEIWIEAGNDNGATKLNGVPLAGARKLTHKDRLQFGSTHMYVFYDPQNDPQDRSLPDVITWEFAQKEIADVKGYQTKGMEGLSRDQLSAQEQILELLPMVAEVNAISEELNKYRYFEVIVLSPASQDYVHGRVRKTKVMVRMKNLQNGNIWMWERGKFMSRRYLIQDLYLKYLDGDIDPVKIRRKNDPFWEPVEDVQLGSATLFLQSLAYQMDYADTLSIIDYRGTDVGSLSVSVNPCDVHGQKFRDSFVDDPKDLLGKPFHFIVNAKQMQLNDTQWIHGLYLKYRVYKDEDYVETDVVGNTCDPIFDHTQMFSLQCITDDHLQYFESGGVTFIALAKQTDHAPIRFPDLTTRDLMAIERQKQDGNPSNASSVTMRRREPMQSQLSVHATSTDANNNSNSNTGSTAVTSGNEVARLKTELIMLQKKMERYEKREARLVEVCEEWGEKPVEEQQFSGFYNIIVAVLNTVGMNKLKSRAEAIGKAIAGLKMARRYAFSRKEQERKDKDKHGDDDYDDDDAFAEETLAETLQKRGVGTAGTGHSNNGVKPRTAGPPPSTSGGSNHSNGSNKPSSPDTASAGNRTQSRACLVM